MRAGTSFAAFWLAVSGLMMSTGALAAEEMTVFVESMLDNAVDCQPDYPTPPPSCLKSRELVKDLKEQLAKSKHFAVASSRDEAELVVGLMPFLRETGEYAVRDNSVAVGNTTYLDIDVSEIKVKEIATSIYRNGEMEDALNMKSVKDIRKKLEKMYRE